jgi:ankyrin repeat protein
MIVAVMLAVCGCEDAVEPVDKQPETNVQTPAQSTSPAPKQVKEPSPAFFDAALAGRLDIVESEIAGGVAADAVNPNQQTALMLAAYNGQQTALMLAAYNGHTNIVAMLIDHGAEINHADTNNRTALMYSSSGQFPKTVKLLIDKGADVNIKDTHEGWTALMFAAAEGLNENVQLLLDAGANTAPKDVDGDTAETFAAKAGHTDVAKMIRDHAEAK